MQKSSSGFTIVELLVTIVVITILVGLGAGVFRGVQDRAKDAKTLSAAEQWIKTLDNYKVRNGAYPATNACLGTGYYNGPNETGGIGECFVSSSIPIQVSSDPAFNNEMKKIISSLPTPAMVSSISDSTNWTRGLAYRTHAGTAYLEVSFTKSPVTCYPTIGGKQMTGTTISTPNGLRCSYILGSTGY